METRDNTGKRGVSVYLDDDVRHALDERAKAVGSTRSQLAAWLLERAVAPDRETR